MWSRQVVRAAGASLIAPIVLLLAAGVMASGGGLGGLDSLGQIASGPSLPDTGLATAPRASIESADVVGTGAPAPSQATSPTPSPDSLASAAPAPSAPRPAPPAGRAPASELRSSAGRPTPGSRPPGAGTGVLLDRPESARPPTVPAPVEELEETTRGLGESVSEPLRPVTNQLLDLLRLLTSPGR